MHVFLRPVDDFPKRVPERLPVEGGICHVGAGNNQGVQFLVTQLLETRVVLGDMCLRLRTARQASHGKEVRVEIHCLTAVGDQAQELPLGCLQGRVGHHVQHPDMQFARLQRNAAPGGQHVVSLLTQPVE